MKKDDNIEDLFKNKFEDFEADVKPDVWKNIRTTLKGFGVGFFIKMLLNKIGASTLIAVTSSLVTIITTMMVMNWSGGKKTAAAENKPTTTEVTTEKIVPVVTVNAPENNVAANHEEQGLTATLPIVQKEPAITDTPTKIAIKSDKREIESVISKFSKKPVADIYASPVGGEVPLPVSLMNIGTGKVNKWSYGDGLIETETSPVHIYNEPGIYKVKLISTNVEGKTTVDSVTIEVVGNPSIPSAPTEISPDGDGYNDEFAINPINIKDMDVIIFDKDGTIIYQWEGVDGKWGGKNLKGKSVNEGMYFYIINAVGLGGKKFEQHGSIKLTRKKLPK